MVPNGAQTLCPEDQKEIESVKETDEEEEGIVKKFKTLNGFQSVESNNRIITLGTLEDDYFFTLVEDDDEKKESRSPIVDIKNLVPENTQYPSWMRNNLKKEIDVIVPLTTIRIRNILQPSNTNIMRNVSFNLSALASIESAYSSPSSLPKRSSLKRSFTSSALCIH